MSVSINIALNEGLFLRDPQSSKLGQKIIGHSIDLINELGFEGFTFKKLANRINSTEASIYRYFENKHLLLIYLISWYWEWVTYLIKINIINIDDPRHQLKIVIHSFVSAAKENPAVSYINESHLHDLVIAEGSKAYHTKEVDKENDKGFFLNYKNLTRFVADIIQKINPEFLYPAALASNLFDMSNNHIYYAKHLPRLTDVSIKDDKLDEVEEMLNYFTEKLLQ